MNARERAKYKYVEIDITNEVEGYLEGLAERVASKIPEDMKEPLLEVNTKSDYGDCVYGKVVIRGIIPKTKEDKEREKIEKKEAEQRSLEYLQKLAAAHGKKLV